ncbi:MAG: NADH-quinone oxidoreductase subunit L [Halofilum sp. (in: g-proteobacteria)]|nr:NADH-quinone oxidoreductase subunit L [Halofilum sp. (in: g-proteobacteria)]
METLYIAIPLFPLAGAIIAGLFGRRIGRAGAHSVTIGAVAISTVLSFIAFKHIVFDGGPVFDEAIYTWMVSDGIRFEIGFLIDRLTVLMMATVTFVSLMVHIYTIGYMHDDPGYQRFFSYISLFTFSMLMLVMSNNFLQLFFGWEAVGVVSYLLIGFWFERESAIFANLKAFLVNRVGDFGFVLGIGAILMYTGSLDYATVFERAPELAEARIEVLGGTPWSVITLACILLFIGAMGKSAQVPLHVWLPDSMEGPTPISALIHAATMVTAGIFMVARMSPLFEFSEAALSTVLVIGAVTALAMGLVGIVQHDIKRVVAYSTLSQLGYMTVALGASAYSAAIFHLMTHAFFKALLFLAAGSVIIALHHEQDMRRMGGLRRYMPVTYVTAVVGSLALIGFPGFAGYFSKDALIEAVHLSEIPGSGFAYWCVLLGVFVTALYTFRMLFLTFHGETRMDEHTREHAHETPLVVTGPLVLLAIPSVVIGAWTIDPVLFGNYFRESIFVLPQHDVVGELGRDFHGWFGFIGHGFKGPAVYLALAGVVVAWFFWLRRPDLPEKVAQRLQPLHTALVHKYGFDELYQAVFAHGSRRLGNGLSGVGDARVIDGWIVNGSAHLVGRCAALLRHLQTGYLFHYAFAMILGVLVALTWIVLG